MIFPPKPTCHGEQDPIFKDHVMEWWQPRDGEDHRTCSYCGCMHPEDLIRLVDAGARVGGSDWKYGWPHKFYVTTEGTAEKRGLWGKWYNEHIKDAGFDAEALKLLLDKLEQHSHIKFMLDENGKLMFHAPSPGYQRP